jgi:cobalt/nickel transport system ATP-binding protein
MSHHIVEAMDLHYAYPDGTVGLNGVSLRITHGESVALVGENGAGKSTLLLHMNGYLIATQGKMRVGDYLVSPTSLNTVRRSVGMVFQNSDDQLFMPTVFEDVAFGPMNLGLEKEELERKAMEALETVGAAHLRNRPPYRLSQGEKRAVAIASVLSMSPDILVMDEPSSSLDPMSRRRLIELLKTFHHTKIIATHDLDMAMDLCERTIVMHKGMVTADGPTMNIFQEDGLLHESRLERPLRMQGCPVCGAAKPGK